MKYDKPNSKRSQAQMARWRREGVRQLSCAIKSTLWQEYLDTRTLRRLRREHPWMGRDCMEEALNDWLNKKAKQMDVTRPDWVEKEQG